MSLTDIIANEATRYLAAVDTFRTEGCAPSWQSESREVAAMLLYVRDNENEGNAIVGTTERD
jgi:hypothetical protein